MINRIDSIYLAKFNILHIKQPGYTKQTQI